MNPIRQISGWLLAATVSFLLAACGGGGGGGGGSNGAGSGGGSGGAGSGNGSQATVSYPVGGTVSGLSANSTLVLLDNKGDALSVYADGSFAFGTRLNPGAAYSVTVGTQPAGEACTVTAGSGAMSAAPVTSVVVTCALSNAWNWMGGSALANGQAVYGSQGVAAAGNVPGARQRALSFKDPAGNLWLFGGYMVDSNGGQDHLNDLWKYSPATGQWAWMSGAPTPNAIGVYGTKGAAAAGNAPGARYGAVGWVDAAGTFWLFGGYGFDGAGTDGSLNDLWKYSSATGLWTWVAGGTVANSSGFYGSQGQAGPANTPGSRALAMGALDNAGNLWLFGGIGYDSAGGGGWLNDLWKYSPASGQWTWISGSETAGARSVYGTQGVAAIGNVPTGLFDGVAWMDASGNFWIFGGDGKDFSDNSGYLNDLWKYNLATGQWTWVSGTRQASAPGSYGTLGTTAVSNLPGANISATAWTDASGDLWFFGGFGPDAAGNLGLLNDLWKYSPSLGQWTWVGGGAHDNQAGVYGIEGTPASSNLPGSRGTLISWPGATGHVWIFGGYGVDSTGAQGYLNDLWEYAP